MHSLIRPSLCALAFGLAATTGEAAQEWSSPWLGKTTLLNAAGARHDHSSCPQEKYVVGMVIRSGTLVDAIGVECAALGPNGEHQNVSEGPLLGNRHGGNARTLRCASGHVVTAMRARAGEFIDQVSFACRSWTPSQGLYGSQKWQPAQGGTGGEPAGPAECPNGMAMTRMWAKATGSYISEFNFTCKPLPPTQSNTTMSAQSALSPQGRAASAPTSRPASIPQDIQPAKTLPQPVAPILKTLSSKPVAGGSTEITIDGEHFVANQVTRVEIAGTSVPYRIVSPTRITATVPQHVLTRLNQRGVPIVVTSGGQRISKQLPLR